MAHVDTALSTPGAPAKNKFQRLLQCVSQMTGIIQTCTQTSGQSSLSRVASRLPPAFPLCFNEAAILQCCNWDHLSALA